MEKSSPDWRKIGADGGGSGGDRDTDCEEAIRLGGIEEDANDGAIWMPAMASGVNSEEALIPCHDYPSSATAERISKAY